jgi:hypothetical protein
MPHPSRPLWSSALLLLALHVTASGAETVEPKPPATTPTTTSGTGDLDALVKDALAGNNGALSTLRTSALGVDDRTAMAVLDSVRATGASRGSAVAACFVRHREAWVQRTAIIAIGKLGADSPETIDLLVKALVEAPPLVAQTAADALADLRDARSWPALIDLLGTQDANQVRLAHTSLQRQTRQQLPAEQQAWEDWYRARSDEETALFAHYQGMLTDTGKVVTAVDGLASLALMRAQATTVLLSLVEHPDDSVRARVERHLRQWTGTLGGESLAVAVDRAGGQAAPPPPSTAPAATESPAATTAIAPSTAADTPGFFETTYGMLLIVTACSGILGILLWFLRTPAGKIVQQTSERITKRITRSRAVVMISNGTKRIAKHIPAPVRSITKRFTAPAKTVAGHLANETQRMLNPHKPK